MVNHEGKANRRFQRAVQVRKHAPESLPEEHQGKRRGSPTLLTENARYTWSV